MEPFNIVFSLFGLLLGLSLAKVLTGFERALTMRPKIHMGWLTPLLGLFVMLDLTSFWNGAWQAREFIRPGYGDLFISLVVTGTYYLAASTVFPPAGTKEEDFDRHYFENGRWILLAIGACNLAVFGWQYWLQRSHLPLTWWIAVPSYFALLIIGSITRGKRGSILCLLALIGIYLFLAFKTLVMWEG